LHSIAGVCILALSEMLDAMLQSKKLQREMATEIKNSSDLQHLLSKVVFSQDDSKIDAESREDHQEWFKGLYQLHNCLHLTHF